MAHISYSRIVPGAKHAVVFIHGILGTPEHFAFLLPQIPKDISVTNLLLDGHGHGVREFSRTSMRKWEAQMDSTVDSLMATHEKVYLVGHSLGTLLAIEQAVKRPVAGLFLLAVPICLAIKPRVVATCWKIYRGRVHPEDVYTVAAQQCCGIRQSKNLLLYLGWIPRFWELLMKIRKIRRVLPQLSVVGKAYQSANDELVSKRSVEYLKMNSDLQLCCLENSTHYYYEPEDMAFLQKEFVDFLRKNGIKQA